ncbi:lymphocyte antigen 6E-like [Discoglossus pictus]
MYCTPHTIIMEASKAILLVSALCIGTAYSLSCYTCVGQSSNANCNTVTNCSALLNNYCMTSVSSAGLAGISVTSITKTCAASCTATSGSYVVASASVSCCSTDLCNTSGAISVKSSYAMLALSVGLLLALLGHSSL